MTTPLVVIPLNADDFINEYSVLEHLRLFSEINFGFTFALILYQKQFWALQ